MGTSIFASSLLWSKEADEEVNILEARLEEAKRNAAAEDKKRVRAAEAIEEKAKKHKAHLLSEIAHAERLARDNVDDYGAKPRDNIGPGIVRGKADLPVHELLDDSGNDDEDGGYARRVEAHIAMHPGGWRRGE